MKMKPKTFIIAIVACVIFAGITIHSFMPSSIISAIGLKTSDISSCCIIVNRTSDPSVDFRGTQLIPLLDALENTTVKRITSDLVDKPPQYITEYVLYFENQNEKFIRVEVRSDGYLFYSGRQYEILSWKGSAAMNFLQNCVSFDGEDEGTAHSP